jgi:two-component system chemotaxis response regulator CheB
MIRVLVAEDSNAVRALLVGVLSAASDIEVVGEAIDGAHVVRLAEQLHPDVITMDIHMPVLDGLAATEKIMHTDPVPIVIVSSTVQQSDLEMTMRALEVGAVAAIPKPEHPAALGFDEYAAQLVDTVRAMAQVKVVRRRGTTTPVGGVPLHSGDWGREASTIADEHISTQEIRIVAIATSTGGPAALQFILSQLPENFPLPIVVVQHIADGFVRAMVDWLGQTSRLPVVMAENGAALQGGMVYIAPSATHMGVANDRIVLSSEWLIGGFRPSATYLFKSVSAAYGSGAMGVILTGMGRDGVDGLRALYAAGGFVIAQDERTSVVFGMPSEAIRAGVVHRVLPIGQISAAIVSRVNGASIG